MTTTPLSNLIPHAKRLIQEAVIELATTGFTRIELALKVADEARPDVMTLGIASAAYMLRLASIAAEALALYRVFFTYPGNLAPKWMTCIKTASNNT